MSSFIHSSDRELILLSFRNVLIHYFKKFRIEESPCSYSTGLLPGIYEGVDIKLARSLASSHSREPEAPATSRPRTPDVVRMGIWGPFKDPTGFRAEPGGEHGMENTSLCTGFLD